MRITVNCIQNEKLKKIDFSSEYGDATAIWIGDIPACGKDYFVEMDIKGILIFNQDICISPDPDFKITLANENIIINAQLEEIVEEGATLRMGDSLVLIETRGEPFNTGNFVKVAIKVDHVTLHNLI